MAFVAQVRRIPTPLAITIGVLLGIFIANFVPGSVSDIPSLVHVELLNNSHSRYHHGEEETRPSTSLHVPRPASR